MILPDVNVLIYAFRPDSERHEEYKRWLEKLVAGPAAYGISPQVLASLIRITTNPRVYPLVSPPPFAFAFCRALMEQPNATLVTPRERHWNIYEGLCREAGVTGNLTQDAWFAALAIEWGCEWITIDRDYARFPGLRWRAPF